MGERGDTAREALMRYMRSIFPGQTPMALGNVADHQIEFLRKEGYRIVPFLTVVPTMSRLSMSDQGMIERMAKAHYGARLDEPSHSEMPPIPWEKLSSKAIQREIRWARATIKAMQYPTQAMLDSVDALYREHPVADPSEGLPAEWIWEHMILAADDVEAV